MTWLRSRCDLPLTVASATGLVPLLALPRLEGGDLPGASRRSVSTQTGVGRA